MALCAALALLPAVASAQPEPFTYLPPGDLEAGSGQGRADEAVYAPGMQFPIEGRGYANSQVWGNGGSSGGGGSQCDAVNYGYPWRDNYCESRTWDMPLCPSGTGHQGQDIRPGTCEKSVHAMVASAAGTVTNIGSYSVYVTAPDGTRYDYLHGDQVAVSSGQSVARGARLGRVSNAFGGTPTTIHLHFNLRQDVAGLGNVYVPPYTSLIEAYKQQFGLTNTPPEGSLAPPTCSALVGAATDADLSGGDAVAVELWFDGARQTPGATGITVAADRTVPGACPAVEEPCTRAFEVEVPRLLRDAEPHEVRAYALDDGTGDALELSGSPGAFTCAPPPVPAGVRRRIADPEVLAAWGFEPLWDAARIDAAAFAAIPAAADLPARPLLVQVSGSPEVWLVEGPVRRPLSPAARTAWRLDAVPTTTWNAAMLAALDEAPPLPAAPFLVTLDGATYAAIDEGFCEIVPTDPECAGTTTGGTGTSGTSSDGSGSGGGGTGGSGGTSASAGGSAASGDAATSDGAATDAALPPGAGGSADDESGCACTSAGSRTNAPLAASLWALGLVGFAGRRRRRRD